MKLLLGTLFTACTLLFSTQPPLQAQWTASTGPLGGDVQAFIYTYGTVLAGTAGGGVYRQLNGNWAHSSAGLGGWATFVNDFARADSVVFAATFGGVYKSIDDGRTWTPTGNGLPMQPVHAVERHKATLYAGLDSGGVFRSMDNGDTWIPANGGLLPFIPVNKLTFLGDYMFAGTAGDGVWFTDDFGNHWTKLDTGIPQFNEYILSLYAVAGRIYAGFYGYGIYYLPMTGGGWQPANNGLLHSSVYAFMTLSTTLYCGTEDGVHWSTNWGGNWISSRDSLHNKRIRSLLADGATLLAGTYGGGVYRQTSKSAPWSLNNIGLKASVISELAITDPYDGYMYACTFGLGLYRRNALGGSWENASQGFQDGALEVNRLYNRGDTLYLATNGGVYYSTNHGTSWIHHGWGMSAGAITALAFDGNALLASTWYNGVYTSTNLASFWDKQNHGLPSSNNTIYPRINDMLFQGDSLFLIMEPDFIFRRNGATLVWDSLQATGLDLTQILRLAVNDSILYAVGHSGVYYSTDYGEVWLPDTLGLGGVNVRKMRIAETNPHAFGYYAHIITDDGRLFFQDSAFGRWREEPLNNTGFMVDMLSDAQNSYASFYGNGVWTTKPFPVELSVFSGYALDSRTNILEWQTETEANNRGFAVHRSLDGRTWEQRGFVHGAGASNERKYYTFEDVASQDFWYRLEQQDFDGTGSHSTAIEIRKQFQPGDYALDCFPNPFSDALTASFTTQTSDPVTVRALDVAGRTLFEKSVQQQAGVRTTVRWHVAGSAVPPGTYIITLSENNGRLIASKRVVKK